MFKPFLGAALLSLTLISQSYAVETAEVQAGVEKYDWKMCVNTETNYCINNVCLTSENINCPDNCEKQAKDKCLAANVNPPAGQIIHH